MSEMFGWDLVYKSSQNEIHKKQDVLTLFVHYILIKGGYKCIGIGEEKVLTGNEDLSETLPPEWSKESYYSLRYLRNNQVFLLKGVPIDDDTLVFNFINPMNMVATNVAFNVESTIGAMRGSLATLIVNHDDVHRRIQSELVNPMGPENTKEATTQASGSRVQSSTIIRPTEPMYVPRPCAAVDPTWLDPERDPLRVGRNDLDPLARGTGGGMIFNPFDNRPIFDPNAGLPGPPLPRGAVPPGSRFDPFGPSSAMPPRARRPPGSDEFPPPGFGDMFM